MIGLLFLWVNLTVIAWAVVGFGFITMLLEYIFYFHFVDSLYPSVTGRNVWGIVEPTGVPDKTIILSGHHDSAQRFNFYEDGKPYQSREKRDMSIFIAFFFVLSFLAVADIRKRNVWKVELASGMNFVVAVIFSLCSIFVREMWFFLNNEGCPGAGDNLISTVMFTEIGRYFQHHKLRRTRVVIVSFDGEEVGLRGSHAFWERHKRDFEMGNTLHLNSDCPYYHDELKFLTRDVNLTVKLDEKLARECVSIATSLGFNARTCPIAFFAGATDSGEAARAGIRSTCLLSLPFTNADRVTVYHTIDDTVDKIEPRAIAQAVAVAMKLVQSVDDGSCQA
jgi:hypothetical protein